MLRSMRKGQSACIRNLFALTRSDRRPDHTRPALRQFCFTGARIQSHQPNPAAKQEDELYNYTSGRWLYNESKRMDERFIQFDVDALRRVTAAAVGCNAQDVVSLTKLAEGGFNRVFQITMQDGREIIARLPYKIAQPKALAIASEVATMDFLRENGLPTPRVYDYSTDAHNSVGAEYIIMEKVSGRPLSEIWFDLTEKQRIQLLTEVVKNETKLFELNLPAMGSIFYSKDLPPNFGHTPLRGSFCVGPDVAMANWFEERSSLALDRYPSTSALDVLQQAARKEIAFLQHFGRPRYPFDRCYRDITNFQKSDPQEHRQNLERFLRVAPHLIPSEAWLSRPTLRHPDLSPNNIFISEKDVQITAIIDWQHTSVLPLFLNASIPKHFSNHGDPESDALTKPQLPALEGLDEAERSNELELYRKRCLHFYYLGATINMAPQHYHAITDDVTMFRQRLFRDVRAPWEGNNTPLEADLVCVAKGWRNIVGKIDGSPVSECPITFTDEEANRALQASEKQSFADSQMRIIQDLGVGCGTDGWVSNENYHRAKQMVLSMKETGLREATEANDEVELEEITKAWVFDDYDENE